MKTILIVDGIINKKYLKNKNVDIFLLHFSLISVQ